MVVFLACKPTQEGSDTLGRGSGLSSAQRKAQCDKATEELKQAETALEAARSKDAERTKNLEGCDSLGPSKASCLSEKHARLDPTLHYADIKYLDAQKSRAQAATKRAASCEAAFKQNQAMSQTSPALVPTKGCYVFRGSKTVTIGGRAVKFGDGVASIPVYIEGMSQGPNQEGKHAVLNIRPKAGASRCAKVTIGLHANELFYPTPAEEKLCNQQCGEESTSISAPVLAQDSNSGCFRTNEQAFLYKDQFKNGKVRPPSVSSKEGDFLVGASQIYYAHPKAAGNMTLVTVKTGSFRGSEGWMDRSEAHGASAPTKVPCPK